MSNANLSQARAAKNDEFYTQYADIEREMNAYLEYDESVFRDKFILLPCDDPEWSNFTHYFAQNFERFGLRKLISTSYAPKSKPEGAPSSVSDLERRSDRFDAEKSQSRGKVFVIDRDFNRDGKIDFQDLEWDYLEGDGDFRSPEVTALRDEADLVITNPPFSLFREYMAWIMEGGKKFAVIANKNCITYKEIFPLIKGNQMWMGNGFYAGNAYFGVEHDSSGYSSGVYDENTGLVKFRNVGWFTNIDHGRRHEPLQLMTMADNLKFNKKMRGKAAYDRYDNYDAIEVPFTNAIPSDYEGVMGVPISFLDKYCPEQFQIVGLDRYVEGNQKPNRRFFIDGKEVYARIAIRHIR